MARSLAGGFGDRLGGGLAAAPEYNQPFSSIAPHSGAPSRRSSALRSSRASDVSRRGDEVNCHLAATIRRLYEHDPSTALETNLSSEQASRYNWSARSIWNIILCGRRGCPNLHTRRERASKQSRFEREHRNVAQRSTGVGRNRKHGDYLIGSRQTVADRG